MPLGTEVPRSVKKVLDDSYIQQHGEDLEKRELDKDFMLEEVSVVGQLETPVDSIMEEDGQSYFGSSIKVEQINAQEARRVVVLPFSSSLQTYLDGGCSIVKLPMHVGGRVPKLHKQIVYVDRVSETR